MDGNGGKQMMVSFMFTVDENSNCSMSLHAPNLGQTTIIIRHKLMVNEGLIGVLLAGGNQTQTNLFI
jgi:hypothetical protein